MYRNYLLSFIMLAFSNVSLADLPDNFNKYILRAVEDLHQHYPSMGYNISKAYTHNIPYGNEEVKASSPPLTMCVAATAEVIITALNIYVAETGDKSVYTYFPASSWNRMRPKDIRSHIWVDPKLDSYGTADALVTFGVGKRVKFSELEPGSFVNFNRLNRTGHSVIFLGFIDSKGNILPQYSDEVRGLNIFLHRVPALPEMQDLHTGMHFSQKTPILLIALIFPQRNVVIARLFGRLVRNCLIPVICLCPGNGMPKYVIKI